MWALLWHWPPLPYPCAPNCHPLCSAGKMPMASAGMTCLTMQSHMGTVRVMVLSHGQRREWDIRELRMPYASASARGLV